MNTRQFITRFSLGLVAIVFVGCTENKQSPLTATTLVSATQESSLESEQPLYGSRTDRLPDADIKRIPISIKIAEAKSLNETVYCPSKTELDSIEPRLRHLLEKEIDVAGAHVLYSTSFSSLNRVPYPSRTALKALPISTKRVFKFCYQEGMVRCVFKIEKGNEQLYQRVFYDDAGAPAVICEHIFGNSFPNAVHYLQYDDRGYLARPAVGLYRDDGRASPRRGVFAQRLPEHRFAQPRPTRSRLASAGQEVQEEMGSHSHNSREVFI